MYDDPIDDFGILLLFATIVCPVVIVAAAVIITCVHTTGKETK